MNTYARFPVAFVRGEGCYLWDAQGNKYLDWLAGIAVCSLGYSHPALTQVISQQAKTLVHTSNLFVIHSQAELAQALCEQSFAEKVFFSNSGAEANETAVKLARKFAKDQGHRERFEVLTVQKSFHGRSLAMIAATGQEKVKKGFEPLPEGFRQAPFNDLGGLTEAISEKTCAVMIEPILGEGGVLFPSEDYLPGVRRLCDEKGLLLILDEIQTGMGRTGKLFAYQFSDIKPDIVTLAKGLGGGVPIGACLATDVVAQSFTPGTHASTFGGNFLVCEAAKKCLEIVSQKNFLEQVRKTGEYFLKSLSALNKKFNVVSSVRGKGLMLGMDLKIPARPLVEAALQKGLVINAVQEKTLRFVPPLVLSTPQVDEGISILSKVLAEAE